jgi:protocatechuate 3,4-dioxygenase beta subunit
MRTAAVILIFSACAFSQPSGSGVLAGHVVDAFTLEPVRRAIVTLTWHGEPISWATARTDAAGKFRFENLPAGLYDLRAVKDGEGVAIYGANSARETGENIKLAEGEARDNLKLRFLRAPAISGRVTDAEGDPIANAQVLLLFNQRTFGGPSLGNATAVQANQRGEYRFQNIESGRYHIYAYLPVQPPRRGSQEGPAPALAGEYYGGTRDPKQATVISIHDGDNLRGIDLQLATEPTVHIRGRVTGAPFPAPADAEHLDPRVRAFGRTGDEFVNVLLVALNDNPDQLRMGVPATRPDYDFDFGWCTPGDYRVFASAEFEGRKYRASQTVGADGVVSLTLEPGVDVSGSIRVDGQPSKSSIRIALSQSPGASDVTAQATDHFKLDDVPQGEWDLFVELPHDAYLKSVKLGDDEVRLKPIAIKSGTPPSLDIGISTHVAKIAGQVDAGDSDPAGAGILLAPLGELHDFTRFYQIARADDHGKFSFEGIAPGKYKVFAFEHLSAAPFQSPEAADSLSSLFSDFAPPIEIKEDDNLEDHPKLIPLERGRVVLP